MIRSYTTRTEATLSIIETLESCGHQPADYDIDAIQWLVIDVDDNGNFVVTPDADRFWVVANLCYNGDVE